MIRAGYGIRCCHRRQKRMRRGCCGRPRLPLTLAAAAAAAAVVASVALICRSTAGSRRRTATGNPLAQPILRGAAAHVGILPAAHNLHQGGRGSPSDIRPGSAPRTPLIRYPDRRQPRPFPCRPRVPSRSPRRHRSCFFLADLQDGGYRRRQRCSQSSNRLPLRGQCFQRVARVETRLFLLSRADRRRVGLGDEVKALVFAPATATTTTTTTDM